VPPAVVETQQQFSPSLQMSPTTQLQPQPQELQSHGVAVGDGSLMLRMLEREDKLRQEAKAEQAELRQEMRHEMVRGPPHVIGPSMPWQIVVLYHVFTGELRTTPVFRTAAAADGGMEAYRRRCARR